MSPSKTSQGIAENSTRTLYNSLDTAIIKPSQFLVSIRKHIMNRETILFHPEKIFRLSSIKYGISKILGIICFITLLQFNSFGQCQLDVFFLNSTCNDNGTPNDPSDDTFIANVFIENDLNSGGTWSSSDSSYTNEPYGTGTSVIYDFGPFPISGDDVTISIVDNQFGCSETVLLEAPEPCVTQNVECKEVTITATLLEIDGNPCTYDYRIEMITDANIIANLFRMNLEVVGGQIDNFTLFDPELTVDASQNTIQVSSGTYNIVEHLLVELFIKAGPDECIDIVGNDKQFYGIDSNGDILLCDITLDLPEPLCIESETVCGVIQHAFLHCDDTMDGGNSRSYSYSYR